MTKTPDKKPEAPKPEPKPLPDSLQSPKSDRNSFQKGLTEEEIRRLKKPSGG